MKKLIIDTLKKLNIDEYIINDIKRESAELFFIKKNLDVRRMKDAHTYDVVVYRDFVKEGKKCRGQSNAVIYPGMSAEELEQALQSAALAASFVANPWYELPDCSEAAAADAGNTAEKAGKDPACCGFDESCRIMTEALFAEDVDTAPDAAFINSAELFIVKADKTIITSKGREFSYVKWYVRGEFVAQCRQPQDVETFGDFEYDCLNAEALCRKIRRTLDYTKARALAENAPKAGKYDVIISGDFVKTIFDYYTDRSGAYYVYAGYSRFKVGNNVQLSSENEAEAADVKAAPEEKGDLITMTLKAEEPYSSEAIPMKDRLLLDKGELKTLHGGARFSYYLGIEPTGNYGSIAVEPGSISFEEMKKKPYLHIVNFSDFQMDSFTGHFGGEIRLAFLFDGEKEIPVTGGSINGSIFDVQKSMLLSREMQEEQGYKGPFAVLLRNVSVAGA